VVKGVGETGYVQRLLSTAVCILFVNEAPQVRKKGGVADSATPKNLNHTSKRAYNGRSERRSSNRKTRIEHEKKRDGGEKKRRVGVEGGLKSPYWGRKTQVWREERKRKWGGRGPIEGTYRGMVGGGGQKRLGENKRLGLQG